MRSRSRTPGRRTTSSAPLGRGEGEVGTGSGLVEVQRGDDTEAELTGKSADLGRRRGPPSPKLAATSRTPKAAGAGIPVWPRELSQTAVSAATSCGPSRTATVRALIAGSSCMCSCRRASSSLRSGGRRTWWTWRCPPCRVTAGDLGDRERAGGLRAPGGQPQLGAGAAEFSGQVLGRADIEPVAEVVGHDDRVRTACGDHRLGGGEHGAGCGAVAPQRQVRAGLSIWRVGWRARSRPATVPPSARNCTRSSTGSPAAMSRVERTGSITSARACLTPSAPLRPSVAVSIAASRASRVLPRSPPASARRPGTAVRPQRQRPARR